MEDKFTNQEEQLKALAEDFSMDIDTSELWAKVEGQLPPVKEVKRRPVFWWFLSSILIIIVGLLGWYNYTMSKKIDLIAEKINVVPQEVGAIEASDTYLEQTDNSPLTAAKPSESITQKTILKSLNDHNAISKSANTKTNDVKENHPSIFNSIRYDDRPTSRNEEEEINQSIVGLRPSHALVDPSASDLTENDVVTVRQKRTYVSASMLNPNALKTLEYKMEFDFPSIEIKPLKIIRWLPFYAFSSGVNWHENNIYSNTNEGIDLAQFKDENPIIGLSSNLQFGLENNQGWRFGIGLSLNRLVSRFSQQESVITIGEIDGNVSSKIDDEGNVIHVTGTLNQTTITHYDLKWHRKHDFVNAQINVGKRIIQNGKFAFYIDANLSRNIWSKHTGYYFTKENNTINKFSNKEDHPYSNAGYSAGLSMDLEYKINEFAISVRPFAQIGLNSITQNSNYYQLKNSLYGVQLGVVYRP